MEGARISLPIIYDTIAGRQKYHYDTMVEGNNLEGAIISWYTGSKYSLTLDVLSWLFLEKKCAAIIAQLA